MMLPWRELRSLFRVPLGRKHRTHFYLDQSSNIKANSFNKTLLFFRSAALSLAI